MATITTTAARAVLAASEAERVDIDVDAELAEAAYLTVDTLRMRADNAARQAAEETAKAFAARELFEFGRRRVERGSHLHGRDYGQAIFYLDDGPRCRWLALAVVAKRWRWLVWRAKRRRALARLYQAEIDRRAAIGCGCEAGRDSILTPRLAGAEVEPHLHCRDCDAPMFWHCETAGRCCRCAIAADG